MSTANSPDANHATPASKRKPLNQRLSFWLLILLVVVIVGGWHYYNYLFNNQQGAKPAVVLTAVAQSKNVPVYLSALGSVTPTYTVTVRTQINGILLSVSYKEGQMVKVGEPLAEIDPRPYEAQLQQYQGQLARDQALLANARIDLKRYQTLWKQDSVSQQTLATQQSLVKQYEGAVETDLGLIQTTKLNLIYCHIVSPVNGRIGLRLVDPGNFVQTSDSSGIAVVTTLDPITVIFTLPEDAIPDVLQKIYANKTFTVKAYDRQQSTLLATGNVLTMDNQVDATTGTVKLRAQFNNKDNRLFASQFVNIRMLLKTLNQATIVPTAAIQYSPKGTFVYVLNPDQTVKVSSVTTGVASGEVTVITSGLRPGQSVVTEGADNLTDGAKVKVLAAKPSSPAVA